MTSMATSDEVTTGDPLDRAASHSDAAVGQVVDFVRAWTAAALPAALWDTAMVVDRHGLDSIPGHRTTPIVAAILAAAGATMPHFSLPAAKQAWSTADTMSQLTGVRFDFLQATSIALRVGACIAHSNTALVAPHVPWSPTSSDSHLVAAALARRVAVGVRHLLINVAVGRSALAADDTRLLRVRDLCERTGAAVGLKVRVTRSVGSQPVGLGIGPAPEALDVLAVLRGAAAAPIDLRMRALNEAGQLLELCGASQAGHGEPDAWRLLDSGAAWSKFEALCEAQGGLHEAALAALTRTVTADHAGHVRSLDGTHLRRVAVMAGVPSSAGAGVVLHSRIGDRVERGQPLFTLHAADPRCLEMVMQELRRVPLMRVDEHDLHSRNHLTNDSM